MNLSSTGVDSELLSYLYIIEDLSISDIACLFACPPQAITCLLHNYAIALKSIRRDELHRLYWKYGKSKYDIGALFGMSATGVLRLMRQYRIMTRSQSDAALCASYKHLKSIDNPSKLTLSYLAGVLAGDGYISRGHAFCLRVVDRDFALFVFKKLKEVGDAKFYLLRSRTSIGRRIWHVSLHRKIFVDKIQSVNFDVLGSHEKKEFINGFLDSEAWVSDFRTYGVIQIGNANFGLLNKISQFLNSLGIQHSVREKRDKRRAGHPKWSRIYSLEISGRKNLFIFHKNFRFSVLRKGKRLERMAKIYGW